jgi:acetoin utilization deacetylase AcuC-like enzyme
MRATASLAVAWHPDCLEHVPIPGHPERAERLRAAVVGATLPGARVLDVTVDETGVLPAVARVHEEGYPERLRAACTHAPAFFDVADNPISAGSYRAAVAAVAATLSGLDAVLAHEARSAWAAVRPPGHHALRGAAMGYCFFNNVAIAAEAALAHGVAPVAIVDFDVHHGNGTQAHFWGRDDVYYLSVHRYPCYPGTGSGDEVGGGRGYGFTRNFPLAAGADDTTFTSAVEAGIEEVLAAMQPRLWLASAGFDAHREDPLGGMAVTEEGFNRIGALLRAASGEMPVLAVLEGGYKLEALRRSVRSFLQGLVGIDGS